MKKKCVINVFKENSFYRLQYEEVVFHVSLRTEETTGMDED